MTRVRGAFVQVTEFSTRSYDEVNALMDGWMADIGAERAAGWMVMGRDRDRADSYLQVVAFDGAEDARRNSDHPVTTVFAEKMRALCDGPHVPRPRRGAGGVPLIRDDAAGGAAGRSGTSTTSGS